MLINCHENNIAIALYHPAEQAKGIATLGKILFIDHNTDQSLSVLVQGLTRIKLLAMKTQDPYPQYFIDDYSDLNEKSQTLNNSPIQRLHQVLEAWLNRHVHSNHERELFMKDMNSPAKLINHLSMLVIKDIELKQIFLESTSLVDRVRMMNALLSGEDPESENIEICEAIKKFERLEPDHYKNAS